MKKTVRKDRLPLGLGGLDLETVILGHGRSLVSNVFCQFVAFTISARVAPLGCPISSRVFARAAQFLHTFMKTWTSPQAANYRAPLIRTRARSSRASGHQKTLKTVWHAALRGGKVPYFRIYDLRSTYATRLSAGRVSDE